MTEYPKAFLKAMDKRDRNLPTTGITISIGDKDRFGKLLILAGFSKEHEEVLLWRAPSGSYIVGEQVVPDSKTAMSVFNTLTSGNWDLRHIDEKFQPWYDKTKLGIGPGSSRFIMKVPSETRPGVEYELSYDYNGNITCNCPARVKCKHIEFIEYLLKGEEE